jgi:peptide/nickel transport system ATP-binding protein
VSDPHGPEPVLEVSGLSVEYVLDRGSVRAVDDVSFSVGRGEFLGIVGEPGCGKSTLLFAVAQLLAPPARVEAGSVRFKGTSLVGLTDKQLAATRWRDLSVVMQSAMNALNPVKSIGAQFKDALRAHGVRQANEIADRSRHRHPAGGRRGPAGPRLLGAAPDAERRLRSAAHTGIQPGE